MNYKDTGPRRESGTTGTLSAETGSRNERVAHVKSKCNVIIKLVNAWYKFHYCTHS